MVSMNMSTAGFRTILLANTEDRVLERFGDPLREAGHRTIEATDEVSLLQSLKSRPDSVDLLLLDLRLAASDRPGLVRKIRAHTANLPVVVFSGSVDNAAEIRQLAALGIAGYVNEHCTIQAVLSSLAPHLFPDRFNRRSSPRIVVAIPISYRVENAIITAVTLNVGSGGLAIRTMNPLDISAKVHSRFSLPGVYREIEVESRVAWSDSLVGMGLQFEQMAAADQAAIDEYVEYQLKA